MALTPQQVYDLIADRVQTQIDGTIAPVYYPNQKSKEYKVDFIKFFVMLAQKPYVNMGATEVRRMGELQFHVFIKRGQGAEPAHALGKSAKDIFHRQLIGGVQFYTGDTVVIGDRGDWYQINILIPFHYYEDVT